MLSSSVTLHRKPKDGVNGKDGTTLNAKDKCVAHYANYTSMGQVTHVYVLNDIVILDSSTDVPTTKTTPGSTMADKPSVLVAKTAGTAPSWAVSQAAENDGYMDEDGNLWLANDTKWVNMGGIKGEKGDPGTNGTDGEDAVTFNIVNSPLTYDTDTTGHVTSTSLSSQTARIYVKQGGVNVTSKCTAVSAGSCSNCTPTVTWSSGSAVISVKLSAISEVTVTSTVPDKDGNQTTAQVSAQAGYVTVAVTYNGSVYYVQIPFQVNLAKLNGGLLWDTKNLTSRYELISTEVGGLQTEYSEIKQDYSSISLKVGEQSTGRVNLLRGTACKRLGEGWAKMSGGAYNGGKPVEYISIINALQGVNALVCMPYGGTSGTLAGFHWIGDAPQGNIPIEKGVKYTISFWAYAEDITKVEFVLEHIWASSLNATRPSGFYSGPRSTDDSACAKAWTADANKTWQLFTRTIIIDSTATYSYLELCLFARAKDTEQTTAYISRPMMERADKYNGWTLAPNDADPIVGNMLDNTRLLRLETDKSGNPVKNLTTLNGEVTDNAYDGCSQVYTSALSQGSNIYALIWENLSITQAEDYTLSFIAKGSGTISVFFIPVNNTTLVEAPDATTKADWNTNGQANFKITSQWQRYTVHWLSVNADAMPSKVYIAVQGRSAAYITQPKLERGTVATAYTPNAADQVSKDELKATGIDILKKKVVVTSDQFEIQNNSGQTTATVDKDGRLTVSDGEFKGTVRAQNFYHGVYVLGQTDPWYRIDVQDDAQKLTVGAYYTDAQIDAAGAGSGYDKSEECTGPCDIILLPIDTSGQTRTIRLPDPKDYDGKVVEISDLNYSTDADTGPIAMCAVGITDATVADDKGGFTAGIYTGSWAGASSGLSFPKGTKAKLLAMTYNNAHYWTVIDKRLYTLTV